MKKILAIFLAALMMFSTFAMVSSAAIIKEDAVTLQNILDLVAEKWTKYDGDGKAYKPVVLIFDPGSAKMGTVHEGDLYYITAGPNSGMCALISENFVAGHRVQLPNIKDAGDGMAANWFLETADVGIDDIGSRTYANGSVFTISNAMAAKDYIVFYAQLTVNEETPVIATIMNVFYKIIKIIFGEQLAAKFEEIMLEFGVVIE